MSERAKHSNQWSQILFEAAYIGLSRDIWLKTKMSLLKLRSCLHRKEFQVSEILKNSNAGYFVNDQNSTKKWQKDTIMAQPFFRSAVREPENIRILQEFQFLKNSNSNFFFINRSHKIWRKKELVKSALVHCPCIWFSTFPVGILQTA